MSGMRIKYVIITGEGFQTKDGGMTNTNGEEIVQLLLRDKFVEEEDVAVLREMLAQAGLMQDDVEVFQTIVGVKVPEDFVASLELKIYEGDKAEGFKIGDDPRKSCQVYDQDGGAPLSKQIFHLKQGMDVCSQLVANGNVHSLDGVLIMQAMIKADLPHDEAAQLKAYVALSPRVRRVFENRNAENLARSFRNSLFG